MADIIDQSTGEVTRLVPRIEAQPEPKLPMITTSADIGSLAKALAEAQAEIENVTKDAQNPHFKSKYADLGAILAEARPKLAKAGIAVIQSPFNRGNMVGIETMLIHSSGQWIKGSLAVQPIKFDAQGAGSVITYLRRYCLASMLGIGTEDDDGEAASGRGSAGGPQKMAAGAHGATQAPAAVSPAEAIRPHFERVRQSIAAAADELKLDDVISQGNDDMKEIERVSKPHYERLLEFARKRREELRKEEAAAFVP